MTSGAVLAVSLFSTVGVLGICIGWFYVRKFNRKRVRLKENKEKEKQDKMNLPSTEEICVSNPKGPVDVGEENEIVAALGTDVICADLGAGILSVHSGDDESTVAVDILDQESEDGSIYSESGDNDSGSQCSDNTRNSRVREGEYKCSTDSKEVTRILSTTYSDNYKSKHNASQESNRSGDGHDGSSDGTDASLGDPVVVSTFMYDIPAELDVIFTPSQRYTINMSIKKGVHLNGTVEAQIDGSQGDNPIHMSDHSDVNDAISPAASVDERCETEVYHADADVDESCEMYVESMQDNPPPYPDFSQEEHNIHNDVDYFDFDRDDDNHYQREYLVHDECNVDDVNSVHSVYSNRSVYEDYNYDSDQRGDHSVYEELLELYEYGGQYSDRSLYSEHCQENEFCDDYRQGDFYEYDDVSNPHEYF